MLQKYSKILDGIDKVVSFIVAFLLAVMTTLIVYQVVLRYVFNTPNEWTEELVRFLFVWITLLGCSIAIRRNSHLKVDMLINIFKPKTKAIIQIFSYVLILVFLVILFTLGIELVSKTAGTPSAGLRVPMAFPYLCIPVGAFLMILSSIEFICKQIKKLNNKEVIKGVN